MSALLSSSRFERGSLKYLVSKSLTKFMLYGILFLILTLWPKISCEKMIMIFYHESIIHENVFFVLSFTSLRGENMRINSRHPWQCCLTEDNYLACIRSCVEGQWGSVRGHHELRNTMSHEGRWGEAKLAQTPEDPSDALISWHLDNNLELLVLLRSEREHAVRLGGRGRPWVVRVFR